MNVQMKKGDQVADVHEGPSVAAMEKQGWSIVPVKPEPDAKKPDAKK